MTCLQRTLRKAVKFNGVGLHTGSIVHVEIRPALANAGIIFKRSDLPGTPYILANSASVQDTSLATKIGNSYASVTTIEHLMGAFFGLGIDNAVVELNSPEFPILDGSALSLLILLDEAGIKELSTPKKALRVLKTTEVIDPQNPDRFIRIEPSSKPKITYAIDYSAIPFIGKQQISISLTGTSFCNELSYARTFCLDKDIEFMLKHGLARGGSFDNAIVVSEKNGILNKHGLRSANEFVKHKALDCVGDLYLAGMPIIGHIIAHKAGHALHTALVKKLILEVSQHEVLELINTKKLSTKIFAFPNSLGELSNIILSNPVVG